MTDELLQLIWVLEATLDNEHELNAFLDDVVASEVFTVTELPQPKDEEHDPPKGVEEEADPYQMSL